MTGGSDKVQDAVNAVVLKLWITLDSSLFSEYVVILALYEGQDLVKVGLVVDVIPKSRGIDYS